MIFRAVPLLVGLALAGPALSQDVVAKTIIANKSVILYDDGGWAYGPEEKTWCAPLDAGIDLCLPTTWARIPNPDSNSFDLIFRADGLRAEVWHEWPLPEDDATPKALMDHLLRATDTTAKTAPYATQATCAGCGAITSVIADTDGTQSLLTVVPLRFSTIFINVTSARPDLSPEDLAMAEALVAGIGQIVPVYEKAFGDGD